MPGVADVRHHFMLEVLKKNGHASTKFAFAAEKSYLHLEKPKTLINYKIENAIALGFSTHLFRHLLLIILVFCRKQNSHSVKRW